MKVLVTPLDWGLGHASRCIPIIRQLLQQKCQVAVGGNGASLSLLKKEFRSLEFYELEAYDPIYPKTRAAMVWKMAAQLPKFYLAMRNEHKQVEQLVDAHKFDLVISDNRYGCWSEKVPSIFITHQSNILMPKRFGWLAPLVDVVNKKMMAKYSECWVPDFADGNNLTGQLNHFGRQNDHRYKFIGPLSRFEASKKKKDKLYNVAVILSGPEPQRTILEKMITVQLEATDLKYCIVRGVFNSSVRSLVPNVFDYLTSHKLQEVIESSEVVVARSGYSTVMDMAALKKKVVFVPTPGQTEQEYLAKALHEKGIAVLCRQHKLDLQRALLDLKSFKGFRDFTANTNLLPAAIHSLLDSLQKTKRK